MEFMNKDGLTVWLEEIQIENFRTSGWRGEKIMRGTPLGNPFHIGKDGNRDQVCDKYMVWLKQQRAAGGPAEAELIRFAEMWVRNGRLVLTCCCAPKRCHGLEIKMAIEGIVKKWDQENRKR